MAFGAGAVAWLELSMALATSPEAYQRAITLSSYPVCAIVIPLVWFIRLRLQAGRTWLAILISALWLTGVLLEFLAPGYFMASLVELEMHSTQWGETYAVGVLTSPWTKSILFDLPTPLIAIFVADASIQAYRRGARRDALVFGGATFFFIVVAGFHAVLVDIGAVQTPYMISVAFVAIAIALGFGLTDDVARTAAATRSLKLQRRRWRALLDGVQLAAIRSDSNGHIAYINGFLEKLLGQTHDEVVGKEVLELAPPDRRSELSDLLDDAKSDELAARTTGALITAQNEVREFVWFNVRLTDSAGAFDGFVSIGEDVTDALRTRQELLSARQDMERLSRILTLGELATTLAHEMSQPIGAVMSNVQAAGMLRKQSATPRDEMDEILDDILYDTRRAAKIMTHIRGFAFDKAPVVEWFKLEEAIEEITDILRVDAATKKVKVALCPPNSLITICASRIELQQILMNLSMNSLQALAGSKDFKKQIQITWQQINSEVEICVEDNGPGLPDGDSSSLFELFSTNKTEGIGIGLAISRRIAERHRGTIEASQSSMGGAQFKLKLPISQEESHIAAQ
ncbi:MAG: ATP-binding protein [Paracoccaceae bacterium]